MRLPLSLVVHEAARTFPRKSENVFFSVIVVHSRKNNGVLGADAGGRM